MTSRLGTLVILGAGGDLSSRLLLPGVGRVLDARDEAPFLLVGVGQQAMTDAEWQSRVAASFEAGGATGSQSERVRLDSVYLQEDVTDPAALQRILKRCEGVPALYFALPPSVTIAACTALEQVELPEGTVLALEKPFGTDLASARTLNQQLAKLVPERQIHRVDHFLGKSTVLNLLGLRFANRIFEQVWDRDNIDRIDIVFDETLALEGRAGYYDAAGALVDMIQSHLLVVLALTVIEPPSSIDPDDLRGAMAQALRSVAVHDVSQSRRAQYTAGRIGDRPVPSYRDEHGVPTQSTTETLAETVLSVDNWRFAGVPVRLRSGKALGHLRKEIVIRFRDVPHLPVGLRGREGPVRLRIALSPEQVNLDVMLNGEGDPFTLDRMTLEAGFGPGELGPYGEVIHGILNSDPTLSLRSDMVEECWRIVTPVLEAWRAGVVPLDTYRAGGSGPANWSGAD